VTPVEISGLRALVERLRKPIDMGRRRNQDGDEAADAIDALHAKIAELEGERDAASARVGEMREALTQARSDFHLITLHGDMHSMWIEAKAARDRTHEALTKEDSRD